MGKLTRRLRYGSLGLLHLAAAAAGSYLAPGDHLSEWQVGSKVYREVEIRSVNARTVTFRHHDGLASVHLRDLAPEWQARFRYDPAAERAADRALQAKIDARPQPAKVSPEATKIEALIRQFGHPPRLQQDIDLRPRFFALELGVKNQGRRPSCAVFAVVSALEYQNAELTGAPLKFSEEYLTWATRQISRRVAKLLNAPESDSAPAAADNDDADTGFTLGEVITALRAYGIPPQSAMPNTVGREMAAIEAPSSAVVDEARRHQRVFIHAVPGPDRVTRIANIIHVLNAGIPVVVGLPWPGYRSLRSGYLNSQQPLPDRGHAVTLVGYRNGTDAAADTVFVFKNSWGVDWGQGGYGLVTYRYLESYLGDAIVLEIAPATAGN